MIPIGGLSPSVFYPVFKQPHIHIHLPDVLMRQSPRPEIDEHKTLEDEMVEDQVDILLR